VADISFSFLFFNCLQ